MAKHGLRHTGNSIGLALMLMVLLLRLAGVLTGWVAGTQSAVGGGGAGTLLPAVAGLLCVPVVFMLPVLLAKRLEKNAWTPLPLKSGAVPVWVLLPLFLALALVLNSLTTLLRTLAALALGSPVLPATLPEGVWERVLYFCSACLFAPVLEELFFRGALQGCLRRFGFGVSLAATAAAFALMHASLWELPSVFVMGLALCYVREITRSVRPCMVLHFANNLLSFVLLLQNDNPDAFAGMATVMWVVLLLLVLFAASLWAIRRLGLGRVVLAPFLAKAGTRAAGGTRALWAAPGFWAGAALLAANYILMLFSI